MAPKRAATSRRATAQRDTDVKDESHADSEQQGELAESDIHPTVTQDAPAGAVPLSSDNPPETTRPTMTNGTSATRGRGGPVRAAARPRGIGRRSQQGRAELERAEAERKQSEAGQRAKAAALRERRDAARKRGSGRGRMRGGYVGESDRAGSTIAGGVFSSGEMRKDQGRRPYSGTGSSGITRAGGSGGSSSARASSSLVKQESGVRDVHMPDSYYKREDGGYISSGSDEGEAEVRKLDIDTLIDLTGDAEDTNDENQRAFNPVRIGRHEHRDRAIIANPDTVKKSWGAGARYAPGDNTKTSLKDRRKLKQQIKDSESMGSSQKFYGVYSDSEGDDEVKPALKDAMDGVELQSPPTSPDTRRKAKERIRDELSDEGQAKPLFQTKEEEIEWEVQQRDLRILRGELGQLTLPGSTTDGEAQEPNDPRADKVYLFQLPAILPALTSVVPKVEGDEIDLQAVPEHDPSAATAATSAQNKGSAVTHPSDLPTGLVGKLRVHASGKAYLDWGGIPMEVSMGQEASFLQDLLVVDRGAKQEDSSSNIGAAMSMGQVKGKFVVVPDWDAIFEQAA